MSARYLNALTGERRPAIPAGAHHGEWWLDDAHGLATLEVDREELPSPALAHAIREVAKELETDDTASFLAPGLADDVRWSAIDDHIASALGPVAAACRRPRSYLRYDEEVQVIGRVRRLAPRAEEHLSAHPEHWQRRTLTSVAPRSVLARVVEEELDIYENRVLASAVDETVRNLTLRIRAVRDAHQAIEDLRQAAEHTSAVGTTDFRLNRRLSMLWGRDFDPEAGGLEALKTLERLEHLRAEYRTVQSNGVCRQLPRGARAHGAIRVTNVLAHDGNYREAKRLLEEVRRLSGSGKSLSERLREESLTALAWRTWVRGVVPQALASLRQSAVPSGAWDRLLQGATFRTSGDGAAFVLESSERSLRIAPLPAALASHRQVAASGETLVVFPDARSNESSARAAWARPIAFVPAGPFVLASVERVSRVLRLWFARGELLRTGDAISAIWHECPVCGRESDGAALESRDGGLFSARCGNCDSRWDARRCRRCTARFPVLYRKGVDDPFREGLRTRDLFARPCRVSERHFACTECGTCDGSTGGGAGCSCSNG